MSQVHRIWWRKGDHSQVQSPFIGMGEARRPREKEAHRKRLRRRHLRLIITQRALDRRLGEHEIDFGERFAASSLELHASSAALCSSSSKYFPPRRVISIRNDPCQKKPDRAVSAWPGLVSGYFGERYSIVSPSVLFLSTAFECFPFARPLNIEVMRLLASQQLIRATILTLGSWNHVACKKKLILLTVIDMLYGKS
jgi:hypothetical protein